jgi:hypothetical protein
LKQREIQHRNNEETQDLKFNDVYRTDNYAEQRGLEQKIYNANPQAQASQGGLNKIKPISDKNLKSTKGQGYMKAAEEYLKRN